MSRPRPRRPRCELEALQILERADGLPRMHVDLVGVRAAGNADHPEFLHAPLPPQVDAAPGIEPMQQRLGRRRADIAAEDRRSLVDAPVVAGPGVAGLRHLLLHRSVIFSGLPMVPAGKIWNLTLPPVNASACLEKPCANCSRCTPPGHDVAVRMVCWAAAMPAPEAAPRRRARRRRACKLHLFLPDGVCMREHALGPANRFLGRGLCERAAILAHARRKVPIELPRDAGCVCTYTSIST